MPCNLQSAVAGSNTYHEARVCEACLRQVVLTIGSGATETYEPRQVRKEAAVSRSFCVPPGSLVRANYLSNTRKRHVDDRARHNFKTQASTLVSFLTMKVDI